MLAASAKCRLGGHTWRYVDYPRIYESCTHHYLNLLHKRLGGHMYTWRYVDYPRFYPPQNVPMAQETHMDLHVYENGFARRAFGGAAQSFWTQRPKAHTVCLSK